MTPVELLQEKFASVSQQSGVSTVTDWMKATQIGLSLQTCTAILLRGQEKGFVAMLSIAAALKCTKEEMQWIAKECGDKYLWRFITPRVFTPDIEDLVDTYQLLNSDQQGIIKSMMKQMVPKEAKP